MPSKFLVGHQKEKGRVTQAPSPSLHPAPLPYGMLCKRVMPTDAAGCTPVAHGRNPPPFAFGVSPWEKDARSRSVSFRRRAVDRAGLTCTLPPCLFSDRCRYFTNVPEMEFLRWLTTQILVSDFPPKNEISLFEPRLSLCLRVPTHTQIKNLHL
jgi:hypothetical protein